MAGAADGFVKGVFTSFLFSTMRRNLLCCEGGAFVQWMAWCVPHARGAVQHVHVHGHLVSERVAHLTDTHPPVHMLQLSSAGGA